MILKRHVDITTMSVERFQTMLKELDAFALGVVGGNRIVLRGRHLPVAMKPSEYSEIGLCKQR